MERKRHWKKLKSNPVDDPAFSDCSNFIKKIDQRRFDVASNVLSFDFQQERVRTLTNRSNVDAGKPILYWMSRDGRVQDNWAMVYAQRLALMSSVPLIVGFCLQKTFLNATLRAFDFLLKGLQEVAAECKELNIHFCIIKGRPEKSLLELIRKLDISAIVTDFSPLRISLGWLADVKNALPSNIQLYQIDAHNVVPCWVTSYKLEYGARTIRKKIKDHLPQYLTEFPPITKHPFRIENFSAEDFDVNELFDFIEVDKTVSPVAQFKPGFKAGMEQLRTFIRSKMKYYAKSRNDPSCDVCSGLSPWFHFGQISVQRCILELLSIKANVDDECKLSIDAFIEEALIRRELSDNFCFYQPNYDNINGAWGWAKQTLEEHKKDKRQFIYDLKELEEANTHDELWNAAQRQMINDGKLHGYMRMYWAKKILEWSLDAETALNHAIYLNDRYNIDGRDPNGYVGCMWSMCGVHDQGWAERPIYGKIRCMTYNGCKRKFDISKYINRYKSMNVKIN